MRKGTYWSPYITGTILGLSLLASFYAVGRGFGASGPFSLVAGVGTNTVAPGYTGSLKYFSRYLDLPHPLLDWGVFLLIGVFLGALGGALFSRNFRLLFDKSASMSVRTRVFTAF
ncbi:MAG: YeeE/YedE family protein, partial [Nitrospirae bacterium]|nr:YeeE/YedE family protein [Nitrospirota bacterium]